MESNIKYWYDFSQFFNKFVNILYPLQVAVEYDCSDHGSLGPINFGYDYCVHVLARHPTLSQEKVDKVIAFAGTFFYFCGKVRTKKKMQYIPPIVKSSAIKTHHQLELIKLFLPSR